MYAVCMNGKGCFYQWDTGQVITLRDTGEVTEVHFTHKGDEKALSVLTRTVGSSIEADVPNILLQSDADLLVYLVCKDENGTETRKAIRIPVIARPKPETYVYTETEVLNYTYLDERLKELEGEGLANAVADYLEKNPPQAGATEEEKKQIHQNKQDIETLTREKLDASELPEAVNDALAQAKASGEFKGEPGDDYILTDADKTEIAELAAEMVEVPEGGSGAGVVVSDSEPEDTSVLWIDTDDNEADNLQAAIDEALAQAKASGEFDGADGKDGKDGQPGADGKDYVLTDTDKQEIAELTAPLVDVPEGGGGGKAKTEKLIDVTFTEATASVSVTLEHDFHKLFLVWQGGGNVRTVGADGAALGSNVLGVLINTNSFGWNSHKVGMMGDDGKTWRTNALLMDWAEDLSTYYGPKTGYIRTGDSEGWQSRFGGDTALLGTVGTDALAPSKGNSVNIVLQNGFLAPGTKVVLVGEYNE